MVSLQHAHIERVGASVSACKLWLWSYASSSSKDPFIVYSHAKQCRGPCTRHPTPSGSSVRVLRPLQGPSHVVCLQIHLDAFVSSTSCIPILLLEHTQLERQNQPRQCTRVEAASCTGALSICRRCGEAQTMGWCWVWSECKMDLAPAKG